MKVLYIANHFHLTTTNDDEGAITSALRRLGHEVTEMQEHEGKAALNLHDEFDFCLFHKWNDWETISRLRMMKVFWYFDLVDWPDGTLTRRCEQRKMWMREALPLVDRAFMTDGDFIDRNRTGQHAAKLRHLPQGFDDRLQPIPNVAPPIPILMVGISRGGGTGRINFVEEMGRRWGGQFVNVQRGVYREQLAGLVGSSKVVVAPSSPVTDRYWSCRVYWMMGLGACLLHPYSQGLHDQFPNPGILWYYDTESLHNQVADLLNDPGTRLEIGTAARRQVLAGHTYLHRCQQLIEEIQRY